MVVVDASGFSSHCRFEMGKSLSTTTSLGHTFSCYTETTSHKHLLLCEQRGVQKAEAVIILF